MKTLVRKLETAIAAMLKADVQLRKRRRIKHKTLHAGIVEAITPLTQIDWDRADPNGIVDDVAKDVLKVFRSHQRRIAAKKGK